jgi:hypothetical protein
MVSGFSKTSEDTGSNPVRGIFYNQKKTWRVNYEKKLEKMEEKRPDEMEMAKKKNEKRKEKKKQTIKQKAYK